MTASPGVAKPNVPPLVSALVVTFRSTADVDACLAALTAQEVDGGMEIVVVDNASEDDTVERARQHRGITLIALTTNTGYAAGNNTAATEATGEIVLLVNPDAVLDPGCVQGLVDHLVNNPGVGAAAATLRSPDGSPQLFARRGVSLSTVLWDMTEFGRRVDLRFRDGSGARNRRYASELADGLLEPIEVDCPAAACIAIWRTLVTPRIFDEAFPLFFNDAELYDRIRSRGYRVEITPAASAQHGYGTSHGQINSARKRAEFVVSLRAYCARRWGPARRILVWLALFMDAYGAIVLGLLTRNQRLRNIGRGTAGGLWLPGGPPPWLSRRPSVRSAIGRELWRSGTTLRRALVGVQRRWLRRRLIVRLHWLAWLHRAPLDVQIARTATIGRHVAVELKTGRACTVSIGDMTTVNDGVVLRLWGGSLRVGPYALVRHGAVLTVKGTLDIGAHAIISRDAQVHADGDLRIGFGAALAERSTVIDNEHTFDDVATQIFDKPTRQADVTIEPFAFIGTGAVVTKGVTVGRSAVIGALSVASRDVPAAMIAVGSPARPLRPVTRRVSPPHQLADSAPAPAAPGLLDRSTRAGAPAAIE
jgi:hypothetical protein